MTWSDIVKGGFYKGTCKECRFEETYEDGFCIHDKETGLLYHIEEGERISFIRCELIDLLNRFDNERGCWAKEYEIKSMQVENMKDLCADYGVKLSDLPRILNDYDDFLENEYCSSIVERYY